MGGHLVGQPISLLIQLAGVPLYLHFWGVGLYGEWLVLFAIPAYLALSDIGFTTATAHAMTLEVSAGNRDAALGIYRTSWWIVTILSIAVGCAIAVAAWSLPIADWMNLAKLGSHDSALVVSLLAIHVILNLQTGLINAGFHSEGEYGEGVLLLALARLAEFVFVVLVVVTGHGPVVAAVALVLGRLLALGVMAWRASVVCPWRSIGVAGVSRRIARDIFKPSMGFFGFTMANALNIQGAVLVIGVLLGPAAAVPFVTLRTLTRIVQQLLQTASTIVRPEIGIAAGRGDLDTMRRLNRDACRLAVWLALCAAVGLALFGDWLVAIWTDGRVAVEQPLFALLLAIMVVNAFWRAAAWTLQAVNRVTRLAAVSLVLNLAAIVVMVVLTPGFGLTVPVAALLAADIAMAVYLVGGTLSYLDESPGRFFRALAVPPFELVGWLRGRRARMSKPG